MTGRRLLSREAAFTCFRSAFAYRLCPITPRLGAATMYGDSALMRSCSSCSDTVINIVSGSLV